MNASGAPADTRDSILAGLCAGFMIAHQVAGKATRDALFLSNYSVSDLPVMLVVAAVVSLFVVIGGARILGRRGPFRVIPVAFVLSAVILGGLALISTRAPRATAVAFYLHFAAFGAVLISGFWSVINERFDPRTARQRIGRIAAGGTFGGLLGGLMAERLASLLSVQALLPALALLHLVCAVLLLAVARGPGAPQPLPRAQVSTARAAAALSKVSYLRNLGALVLTGTMAAACLDYIFKARATESFGQGEELLRFFALFYTAASLISFLLQAGVARRMLERVGLARTVATLPTGIAVGALGTLLLPGLGSATAARGLDSALRNSLFRSGYEPLYIPLPPEQKRVSKQYIDVGFERLGDALGGGLIRLVLFAIPALSLQVLAGVAVALGLVGIWITQRVQRGWVRALERSLETQAAALHLEDQDPSTQTMVMRTLQGADFTPVEQSDEPAPIETPATGELEPTVAGIVKLRSGEVEGIRRLLERTPALPSEWVPHVLPLLAWDAMSRVAMQSLENVVARHSGQLIDALLDPETDFAIRRRLPPVLSGLAQQNVVEGLLAGLSDPRFEVRYQCGRALLRLRRRPEPLSFDRERVLEAVLHEVRVEKRVWAGHRLLDQMEPDPDSPFDEELLRRRSNRGLEHVFTVLAVVFAAKPLSIAYRGLFTDDKSLRGTSLEYLESILPDEVRAGLWPFLEAAPSEAPIQGDRERLLERLLQSHASIQINLKELGQEFPELPGSSIEDD